MIYTFLIVVSTIDYMIDFYILRTSSYFLFTVHDFAIEVIHGNLNVLIYYLNRDIQMIFYFRQ